MQRFRRKRLVYEDVLRVPLIPAFHLQVPPRGTRDYKYLFYLGPVFTLSVPRCAAEATRRAVLDSKRHAHHGRALGATVP